MARKRARYFVSVGVGRKRHTYHDTFSLNIAKKAKKKAKKLQLKNPRITKQVARWV